MRRPADQAYFVLPAWLACLACLLAEFSLAARSKAQLREARSPPKAACAGGAPEPREGFKQKHGCVSTGCD